MTNQQPKRRRTVARRVPAVAVIGATAGTGFLTGWATGAGTSWSILQSLAFGMAAAAATYGEHWICHTTRHGH